MQRKLIIYGIGKMAQYIGYVFQNDSEYEVIAYCIEEKLYRDSNFDGKPLVKFESLPNNFSSEEYSLFIAVGNNLIRSRLYREAKGMGFNLATYISSKAHYWKDIKLGKNVFIGEGCVIQPFVEISDNSFLMGAKIGHHCKIKNNVLMTDTTVGGNSIIEDNTFCGMHSTIKHNVVIGNDSIIGMNVSIENNVESYSVYSNNGSKRRRINSTSLQKKLLL